MLFFIKKKIALVMFFFRSQRRRSLVNPIVFLRPDQLVDLDLDLYEPENGNILLDKKLADEMHTVSIRIASFNNKLFLVSSSLFIFSLLKVYGVELGLNVFGFHVSDFPGALELILVINTIIGIICINNDNKMFILNSYINHIINKKLEPELYTYYKIKYDRSYIQGFYHPFNLPHITFNSLSLSINSAILVIFLVSIFIFYIISFYFTFVVLNYVWIHESLKIYSKVIVGIVAFSMLSSTVFFLITRLPIPYRDYTSNQVIQVFEQLRPDIAAQIRSEIYAEFLRQEQQDRDSMVEKGYLKPN